MIMCARIVMRTIIQRWPVDKYQMCPSSHLLITNGEANSVTNKATTPINMKKRDLELNMNPDPSIRSYLCNDFRFVSVLYYASQEVNDNKQCKNLRSAVTM